jgi:negative regulator of sigma E activity
VTLSRKGQTLNMPHPGKLRKLLNFRSRRAALAFCVLASCLALVVSLVLQWVVYDDWLHETGPLHVIGSVLAAVVTFTLIYERQRRVREQNEQMIRQFHTIAYMNDRIRNALQAIECSTYVSNPDATAQVRSSVENIEAVLRDVIADFRRPSAHQAPGIKSAAQRAGRRAG